MGQADSAVPSHPAPIEGTEKRYLRRNLLASLLFRKISGAERRMEAGERSAGPILEEKAASLSLPLQRDRGEAPGVRSLDLHALEEGQCGSVGRGRPV